MAEVGPNRTSHTNNAQSGFTICFASLTVSSLASSQTPLRDSDILSHLTLLYLISSTHVLYVLRNEMKGDKYMFAILE